MSSASQGYVQIATDGTGKKVLNLVQEVTLDDGTVDTVYTQVVALVDDEGEPVDLSTLDYLPEIACSLEKILAVLERIAE